MTSSGDNNFDPCIHGEWKDGVCVCNRDYALGFNERILHPNYCEHELVTIIKARPYITSEELIHATTMGMTAFLATLAFLSFFTLIITLREKFELNNEIHFLKEELHDFNEKQEQYQSHIMLDATVWTPPKKFKSLHFIKE